MGIFGDKKKAAEKTARREGIVLRVTIWGGFPRPSGCSIVLAGHPEVVEMQLVGKARKTEQESRGLTFCQPGDHVSFCVREIFDGTMRCLEFVNHTWLEIQKENAKR